MAESLKPSNQFLSCSSRIEFVEVIVAEFNIRGIGFENLKVIVKILCPVATIALAQPRLPLIR